MKPFFYAAAAVIMLGMLPACSKQKPPEPVPETRLDEFPVLQQNMEPAATEEWQGAPPEAFEDVPDGIQTVSADETAGTQATD